MALVTWSDKYSMNIKEIDEQHKNLVRMINELHDAMLNAKSKEVALGIINEMAEYTQYHFSTEEKYMVQYKYPEYAAHKKEHDKFIQQVGDFKKDYESGKAGLSFDLLNFLKNWLVNHIQESDKKYSPFFNEKGLN
ncbi:hemerythrin family protein [Methanolobus zinderi]|uniref:Hemerythrin family protein n=1 Tax=Methanolobus zinderi TaxID=536044 RepID=A0A7D5EA12_9EURY|nr:bacteriohemerythrin [Methanolobus zinderi]QLC50877.1 hemerythrin family protein [Methanolobus zinderi]